MRDDDDFDYVVEDGEAKPSRQFVFDEDSDIEDADFEASLGTRTPGSDEEAHDTPDSEYELEIVAKCYNSRIYFAEVVLGVDLDDWQYDVLLDLDNGATRISIRSGNGAGKTCLLSIIILHFILFRNDVKVPVTAPSSGQLKDGLIPETRKWMRKLPDFLRAKIDHTQDRIYRVDSPEQDFVSFRTARRETPEALQGIHATFVLCVVDEASGVPDEVYEAAQGTMSTEGAIFIMISNPTRLKGYFYRSHHRMKAAWHTYHVTSFDSSRVDVSFIKQISDDYGENSDQYRVKVLGNFPTRDEQTLIGNDVVRAALGRDIVNDKRNTVWGVDVGRGGDLSSLVKRSQHVLFGIKTQNYSDTMKTVAWVKKEWDETEPSERPSSIFVDVIGIGAGVADRLREMGLPIVDVNVAESPSMSGKYVRLRDEIWWAFKTWLETGNTAIDCDGDKALADNVESEVCAPLQKFTDSGKDAVESKKEMRARGIRSPNIADAACMTFAFTAALGMGLSSSSSSSWSKPLPYKSASHTASA